MASIKWHLNASGLNAVGTHEQEKQRTTEDKRTNKLEADIGFPFLCFKSRIANKQMSKHILSPKTLQWNSTSL